MKVNKVSINTGLWAKLIISLAVSFILVLPAADIFPMRQIDNNAISSFEDCLDKRIPAIMKTYGIPGAEIAVIKEGEVALVKAYGYADLDSERKLQTDDHMRTESISKSITAWGIMKLNEEGRIGLDDPIYAYLTSIELPHSAKSITIRQLLTHTSGLGETVLMRFSPDEIKPELKESLSGSIYLVGKREQAFNYSNVNYDLLELITEEVTGTDFSEYMKNEVLLPLGMKDSSFSLNEEYAIAMLKGYDLKGEAIEPYVYQSKAAGNLTATASDIALFVSAQMTEYNSASVISVQSINEMHSPTAENLGVYGFVFDSYGLGCYTETLADKKTAIAHSGQGAGWLAHYHAVPETGDGIVILTNSQRSWPLISYLLSDWTKWCGLPPPGLKLISIFITASWIFIGILWLICVFQILRLTERLLHKERIFIFSTEKIPILSAVQFLLGAAVLSVLLFCILEYGFLISSALPIISAWLCASLFVSASLLFFSSLFPSVRR